MTEEKTKRRFGFKRWIVLALVAAGIYCAFFGPSVLKPISPMVVLPPEPTGLNIFGFQITNSILATLIADLLLILVAVLAYRFSKSGKEIPSGFYNAFEALVEFLWNNVQNSAGKWARRVFAIPATIFLLVFVANMVKLLPGFESIGYMKEAHGAYGYKAVTLIPGFLYTIDKGHPISEAGHDAAPAHAEEAGHAEDEHTVGATEISEDKYYEVVPFLRGSATDINFPFALAIIAVVTTQVFGVMSQGVEYFHKFFPVRDLKKGAFGVINLVVGLLELVLEFAKILSFGFRLFGNIFAGALLLSIVGALTAVVVPAGLYGFEIFFGVIQAYIFFLLSAVFMGGATVSHGGEHAEAHY